MANNIVDKKNIKGNKKNLSGIILLSIVFLTIIIISLLFFNRSGKIQGQIVDSRDSTITLTDVLITIDDNEPKPNNNLTGTFYFEGIKPGNHIVKFTRDNYKAYEQEINLKAGEKLNLSLIRLTQATLTNNISLDSPKLLVENNSDSLTLIDLKTNSKTINIPLSGKSSTVLVNSAKSKIYTIREPNDSVGVIDLKALKEVKNIKLDALANFKLQFSISNDRLYALAVDSGKLFVINTITDELIEPVIKVSTSTNDFVVDKTSGNLILVDETSINIISSSGNIIKSHTFQPQNGYNKIYSGLNYVIVGNATSNFATHIDLISDKETKLDFSGQVRDIKISPSGIIYVLLSSSLNLLRASTLEIYKKDVTINGQVSYDMTLSTNGDKLYIADFDSGKISVFDTQTEQVLPDQITGVAGTRDIIQL